MRRPGQHPIPFYGRLLDFKGPRINHRALLEPPLDDAPRCVIVYCAPSWDDAKALVEELRREALPALLLLRGMARVWV